MATRPEADGRSLHGALHPAPGEAPDTDVDGPGRDTATHRSTAVQRLATDLIRRWRQTGEAVDVDAALREHPELALSKSAMLDLAFCEYRFRRDAGQDVPATRFVDRFPHCRASLNRLIAIDQLVSRNPDAFGLADQPDWSSLDGEFLNFTLVEELGRGAIGRVFLAEDRDLSNRSVVLKITPGGVREARTLCKLDHRNVVQVHSVDEDCERGLTGICMPFLGRTTLQDFLDVAYPGGDRPAPRRFAAPLEALLKQYDPEELRRLRGEPDAWLSRASYVDGVLHVGRRLADALAHTHAHGVLHRDLKPSNVLLTPDGVPVLLDFNLSTTDEGGALLVGGTLPYMSPEQVRDTVLRRPRDLEPIDGRSDIFALGVILYELLTGRHPFGPLAWDRPGAEVARELLERQRRGPTPVDRLNPAVDGATARLVSRCLAEDLQRRPRTAEELRDALTETLSAPRRCLRRARARPLATAAWALAAALVCAAAAAGLLLATPAHMTRWHDGVEAYRAGRYEAALVAFNDSIDHHEDNFPALFGRAQTRLKLQDYAGARSDFQRCYYLKKIPELIVAMAYASDRGHRQSQSAIHYTDAERAGCASFAFHNNLGYSYSQRYDLSKAEHHLGCAVTIDPTSAAARYNRAVNSLRVSSATKRPISETAIEDIEIALRSTDGHAVVYATAARIYSRSRLPSDSKRQKSFEYLRMAVTNGIPSHSLSGFSDDPFFTSSSILANLQRTVNSNTTPQAKNAMDWLLINPCGEKCIFEMLRE